MKRETRSFCLIIALVLATGTVLSLFTGCTYDEQASTYRALNSAVGGYYNRPATTTTTTVDQTYLHGPLPAQSPTLLYAP